MIRVFFNGCQLCQAPVGSLWHRGYLCPASAEFRRGYCQDFDLDEWLDRMPLSRVAGMLWTRLTLHVVWEVHPLVTGCAEELKVTAKLHRPLPGLHQDITLAESVAFLWYLRHVSALWAAPSTRTP